jgi:hypothetical protein
MRRQRVWAGLIAAVSAAVLTVAPIGAQTWTNVTGNLAYKLSECGTLTLMSAVPNSPAIIAGIAGRDLWVNTGEPTWSRLSDITRSERILNRPSSILYDPADPAIFWESGVYNNAGVYKTTDGGKTFARLGDVVHNDHISVDFSDAERRTLITGGHEQDHMVYRSADKGLTWTNIGRSLPPGNGFSSHPLVIDALTYVVNVGLPVGATNMGIYRTKDGGTSWERVSTLGPPGPPLRTPDGIIYWAMAGRLLRSTTLGATWTVLPAPGLKPGRLAELPGGRIAAIGESTIIVTADGGSTWLPLGPPLPYPPDGLIYSPERKAIFIWRATCTEHVAPNAVMKLDVALPTPPGSQD